MASIIQVILEAQDRTGPAFASARANVQSLRQTQATSTTASNSAVAQVSQLAQVRTATTASITRAEIAAAARIGAANNTAYGRVEAQRLSGIARTQAAALQADARITAAERAADARIEAERIRAINRIDVLERRNAAKAAQGPALPRTFAGFTGQGALQAAGAAGLVTSFDQLISKSTQYADQGQRTQVVLDQTRASLGALLSDQTKANAVFDRAVAVGQRYGFTQQDTAEAIRASSLLIRESQAPIEEIFTTLAKLQVLSPEQGLSGASLALKELNAGDIVSLRERFEVSASAANEMKREIQGGADAVQVMGRYLRSIGITDGALESNLAGAAGQQRAHARATEELGLAINDIVTSSGWRTFATGVIQNTAREITWLKDLGIAIDDTAKKMQQDPGVRFLEGIDNFFQGEIDRDLRRIQEWTGQATKARQEANTAALHRVSFQPGGNAPAAATVAPMPSVRFAGFGGVRMRYPEAAPPVQNIVNVTVHGSVLSEREVGEIGHRYLVNLSRRNAGNTGLDP